MARTRRRRLKQLAIFNASMKIASFPEILKRARKSTFSETVIYDNMKNKLYTPQIKICGLTQPEQARACADLGADAVGLVFYPKSPRFIAREAARLVCAALPASVAKVGVFVDEPINVIIEAVRACGLTAVQLHGGESPQLVKQLAHQFINVIKALYVEGLPAMDTADDYPAAAFLIECKKGILPGGNAMTWDWTAARDFAVRRPLILAGGLDPENVGKAIRDAVPDVVDVSSGVEASPGIKDMKKVDAFIRAVRACNIDKPLGRIFS
jgi:phosphoribosylanthranilate isomerase